MRMATFNILHGHSVEDGGSVDIGRFADCVRQLDVDVLALQEVDCDQPRSAMADLTAVAAEAMGAVSHRFVAAISGTPGATWMAATGRELPGTASYGIALLSRFEASTWQVLRLPRIPTKFPMYLPGPNRVQIVDEEPRAAVLARLETDLGPLTVANTHLSFVPGWNRVQLRRLRRDLLALPDPLVLMGDLNMAGDTPWRLTGYRPLARFPTFPSDAPTRQLDHILLRGPLGDVIAAQAPELPLSDHRPLTVEVRVLR
jgi:endonuclease/exonuclease/phosphatase family metal-dependent hydrolase